MPNLTVKNKQTELTVSLGDTLELVLLLDSIAVGM